ncbi:hypothetical protein [Chryseolinea lacunae]|uniref:DUF4412 domain-containing protein n=1 Tax=Chryseolinea lacunae TaxID=2801331 RepID=A0ABS1KP43_9BACT|nr:hypothetical protein [Chryseolinea lacunae]MBL0741219.1 hypothetical protein [Chryseolinea lacunae]
MSSVFFRKVFLCVLFSLAGWMAVAQAYKAEEFQATKLKARYGAMIVYNGRTNAFSFRIAADSIGTPENPNFLWVDGKLLQATIIPFVQKANYADLDEAEQKRLLEAYRKYEQSYFEKELNAKLKTKAEFITLNHKTMLLWTIEMPKDSGNLSKQFFIFTICFDQMLTFNMPVEKGQDEVGVKDVLTRTAESLELSYGKLYDLNKLYYELK